MTNQVTTFAIVSLLATTMFAGCSKTSEPASQTEAPGGNTAVTHDPDDIPLTDEEIETLKQGITGYADALSKIKSYRNIIRDAIAAGDPPKAHRSLDELDIVLEHMPTVARDNNIPKSQWETVNTSAQQVRDLFNKLHAQIDGGEKVDYEAVADDIDSSLARLEGAQPAS
jgi:hypothetical protein